MKRPVTRNLQVELRPSAPPANLAPGRQIDPLSGAAAHVAQVATPPPFTAQRESAADRECVVDIGQLAVETGSIRDGATRIQPSVKAGKAQTGALIFHPGRMGIADAGLRVGPSRLF